MTIKPKLLWYPVGSVKTLICDLGKRKACIVTNQGLTLWSYWNYWSVKWLWYFFRSRMTVLRGTISASVGQEIFWFLAPVPWKTGFCAEPAKFSASPKSVIMRRNPREKGSFMPQQTKIFRVFISSTFSDMKEERRILQKEVFPELEKFCEEAGAKFHAVDLRWGVNEESSLNQKTLKICFNEIKRCQKISPRPNFIVLLRNGVKSALDPCC